MLVVLSILIIHAIAKGLQDRIRFKGFTYSDWMNGRGKFSWDKRTFWTKYVFSFVSDGWHLMDAIRVMSLCILVAVNIPICQEYIIISSLLLYIVHGIIFEITYNIKSTVKGI